MPTEPTTERFTLPSSEGLPIRVVLDRPQGAKSLVVIIHGFKGFKDWGFFPFLSEAFALSGFAACRFDMSRNGVGDDPEQFDRLDLFAEDTYSTQLSDLNTVVTHLRTDPGLRNLPIFLLGHSRGGAIALLGSSRVDHLCGVITWSSISTVDRWDEAIKRQWRRDGFLAVPNQRTGQVMKVSTRILEDCEANGANLDVLGAVRSLRTPLLIVHGAGDETVALDEARVIASNAVQPSLVVIAGASHTYSAIHPLINIPAPLRTATRVTLGFLTAYS